MFNLTLDQLIATSASVAAAVSAIATFLTVIQISIQRKASYKPELVFARTAFDKVRGEGKNPGKDPLWKAFAVRTYNIGLGPAKNITISWSFPIGSAVAKVNSLAALDAKLDAYKLEGDMLSSAEGSTTIMTSMWKNQKIQEIDFALPASINDQPASVYVPHAYLTLWFSYVTSCVRLERTSDIGDFPPLKAVINFKDVGGSRHKIKQQFTLNMSSYMYEDGAITGYVSSG